MITVTSAARDFCGSRVGAHLLCSYELAEQYNAMVDWVRRAPCNVVESKFSLEVAWLQELNWELRRRGMLEVH